MQQPRRTRRTIAAALLAAWASAGEAQEQGTWPQWRGPARDGRFEGPRWPDRLSPEHLAEAWRVDALGPSYSGPVVADERVFTTATEDEEREVVRAFDRESGEELWSASWQGAMQVPFFAARNGSWIRSTPALDGDSLFVAGMRDVLVCLDVDTGEVRWRVDFTERFESPLPSFGFVCSPLVVGDHVVVQAGASVVQLDKRTGETRWRSLVDAGGTFGSAFSSPVLATLAGRPQLVVQTRTELAGLAPDDGEPLWSTPIRAFRGMNILTPLVVGDGVFTAPYGGRAQLLGIGLDGEDLVVEREWENRAQGYMTSPVEIGGCAYLFLRSNRFACVDLGTGEDRWISPPTGDSYWSLAFQEERILALSDTGVLRLVAADPKAYRVLDERELVDGETWAHLAPAGRQLFVRGQDALFAFTWK